MSVKQNFAEASIPAEGELADNKQFWKRQWSHPCILVPIASLQTAVRQTSSSKSWQKCSLDQTALVKIGADHVGFWARLSRGLVRRFRPASIPSWRIDLNRCGHHQVSRCIRPLWIASMSCGLSRSSVCGIRHRTKRSCFFLRIQLGLHIPLLPGWQLLLGASCGVPSLRCTLLLP